VKSKETLKHLGNHITPPLGVSLAYSLKNRFARKAELLRIFIKKNFITKDLLKTLGDPEEELEP
jgi:hypothetical protein